MRALVTVAGSSSTMAAFVLTLTPWIVFAQDRTAFNYQVTPDVVYGQGMVTEDGQAVPRNLWMDVYQPREPTNIPRAAVIFTHGGAFHRGSPRNTYHELGAQTVSPGDYCRNFAERGYVCFALSYRLASETPIPARTRYTDGQLDLESITPMMDQVNLVRGGMGLPRLDTTDPDDMDIISNAVLSAAEDVRAAFDHVVSSAQDYQVDPDRILLGGFSAGAVTSLSVAHGMGTPVAGVFMLSGGLGGFDIFKTVTPSSDAAPALLFVGANDLAAAIDGVPALMQHYARTGVAFSFAWVPGFGHFYPSGATSLGADATKMAVEQRIVEFIERVTAP